MQNQFLSSIRSFVAVFSTFAFILAGCSKPDVQFTKQNFTLKEGFSEEHIAPVYKKNNVPPSLSDAYIVVFNDDVKETEVDTESDRVCGESGSKKGRSFKHALKGFTSHLSPAAVEKMRRDPRVKYIEQDQIATMSATQFTAPWGLDRIDQSDNPLSGSYTYASTGSTVDAYIFDTGLKLDHNEFAGRVKPGYNTISVGASPADDNGHGTHVAGSLGGTRYGVAKGISIIPVKVLDQFGTGSYAQIIAGIDWAIAHHTTKPAVGNMSLGGGVSAVLDDAVRRAVADGIVMCLAGGNAAADVSTTSPARVTEAITVGSTTKTDELSNFSNFGTGIDLLAPGSAIVSAWHTGINDINTISGTSMATPHVAGAAALYLESFPGSTPDQVQAGLKSKAVASRITLVPAGTPNLLLQTNYGVTPPPPPAVPVPTAPVLLAPASASVNQSLTPTLSWNASSGAATYDLQVSTTSNFTAAVQNFTGLTTTSKALSGLANNTVYYWRVSATNASGTSLWSATFFFTTLAAVVPPPPATTLAAPVLVSPADRASNVSRTPTLTWAASTGATSYKVQVSTNSSFTALVVDKSGVSSTSLAITTSLASRRTLYWRVQAVNGSTTSAWSTSRRFTTMR
jgi:subtilisin family serine protease